jgi:hypothetical protein
MLDGLGTSMGVEDRLDLGSGALLEGFDYGLGLLRVGT